jgi:hypothetical protein
MINLTIKLQLPEQRNGNPVEDAQRAARELVAALRAQGHVIETATFAMDGGGRVSLLKESRPFRAVH